MDCVTHMRSICTTMKKHEVMGNNELQVEIPTDSTYKGTVN